MSFAEVAPGFAAGFAAGRTDEAFAAVTARDVFFSDANGTSGAADGAGSTTAALPFAGAVVPASGTGALFAGIPAEVAGASLATFMSRAAACLSLALADFQLLNQAMPPP